MSEIAISTIGAYGVTKIGEAIGLIPRGMADTTVRGVVGVGINATQVMISVIKGMR